MAAAAAVQAPVRGVAVAAAARARALVGAATGGGLERVAGMVKAIWVAVTRAVEATALAAVGVAATVAVATAAGVVGREGGAKAEEAASARGEEPGMRGSVGSAAGVVVEWVAAERALAAARAERAGRTAVVRRRRQQWGLQWEAPQ